MMLFCDHFHSVITEILLHHVVDLFFGSPMDIRIHLSYIRKIKLIPIFYRVLSYVI